MRYVLVFWLWSLPLFAMRIVSLAPVATEFLFALGVGDQVVGVTKYCDRPSEAQRITKIGGFADPQLEAIIKLQPDLVVATPFGAAQQVVRALASRKVATLAQPVETIDDMRRFLAALGKATQHEQQAAKIQRDLDAGYAKLKHTVVMPKNKTLLLISVSPLIAAGPQTFAGEILQHLGATNAVSAKSPAWPVMSLEALMQSPPDVVIVTEGIKHLDAAKKILKPLGTKIRIVAPDQPFLQRPGPYMLDDAQTLLSLLRRPHV